jgi:UDP-3-O-acyl-N-acetylglucosamine deacetylase
VREHVAENTDTVVSTIEELLAAWTNMVIDGIRKR